MKYIKLLSLFLVMHTINLNAMHGLLAKRYEGRRHRSNGQNIILIPIKKEQQAEIKMPLAPHIPAEFCAILKEKIFTIPFFLSQCSSLDEAGKLLCNLVATNRYLNFVINDQKNTRAYIQYLSDQFGFRNSPTAKRMCTYGSKIVYMNQHGFRSGGYAEQGSTWPKEERCSWCGDDLEYNEELLKFGFNVNWSYDKYGSYRNGQNLLLYYCSSARGYFQVIKWLIKEGSDIKAVCPRTGNNACMLTLLGYNSIFLPMFVCHKDFEPNHQNHEGKTTLHLFFDFINARKELNAKGIYDLVLAMLVRGANPILPDKEGKTALDLANQIKEKEIRKPIVELLEKAETEFNSLQK